MVGWHRLHGHEFEQTPGDSEKQGSPACCSPRGREESDATERLKNSHRWVQPLAFLSPRPLNWGLCSLVGLRPVISDRVIPSLQVSLEAVLEFWGSYFTVYRHVSHKSYIFCHKANSCSSFRNQLKYPRSGKLS